MQRILLITALIIVVLLTICSTGLPRVRAANLTVNTIADTSVGNCDTTCSLRDAITIAHSFDIITFAPGLSGTIYLATTINIVTVLTINGPGTDIIAINAANARAFTNYGTLNVSGVTINHDPTGSLGGGIANLGGTVNVDNVVFKGNTNPVGGGAIDNHATLHITNTLFDGNYANQGGAIRSMFDPVYLTSVTISNTVFRNNSASSCGALSVSAGSVTITNSLFQNNSATSGNPGGAICTSQPQPTVDIIGSTFQGNSAGYGGAISVSASTVNINNSTFQGNSTQFGGHGGAIFNSTTGSAGYIYIVNSTFQGNSASYGGTFEGPNSPGFLFLTNTIVSESPSGGLCVGVVVDQGHNLFFPGSYSGTVCNTSIPVGDPKLAPLADNGGPVLTMALQGGSAAIDGGDNSVCTSAPINGVDQRGISRLVDGDQDGNVNCDIGAYEAPSGTSLLAPTLVSPSGTLTSSSTSFVWHTVPQGQWYYLWLSGPNGHVLDQWYDGYQICSGSTCTVNPPVTLTNGNYIWYVEAWGNGAYGRWSAPLTFSVTGQTPSAATLIAPTGSITNAYPTFTWQAATNAQWYYIWVSSATGKVIDRWYDGNQICAGGTCLVTLPVTLTNGDYIWWVQTWGGGIYGPWSSGMTFSVTGQAPGTAIPIAPIGTISNRNPTFTWQAVTNAQWYYIWLSDIHGHVLDQWFNGSLICSGGTCSVTPTLNLPDGDYLWWVQTWGGGIYGPWSGATAFTVSGLSGPSNVAPTPTPAPTFQP